jgi:hypothetical protein
VKYVKRKLCAFLLALTGLAGPGETSWDILRRLPKNHLYTVLNRNGACVTGTFVSLSDIEIVLALPQKGERSFSRADILRISLGETADVHSAVYSARSSWSDLLALQTPPYYSDLMVVTSDNRQFKGPLLAVSTDQLTLYVDNHEMRFTKEYVDRVLLTSTKPTFEQPGQHRSLIKLPKKGNSQMQPVPLYEITAHQDDSKIDCQPTYRRQ